MTTLFNQFQELNKKKIEPISQLLSTADAAIDDLKHRLAEAQAEITALKSATCPKCGVSLPPDGKCYKCLSAKLPKTAQDGFRQGVVSLGLSIAACREKGVYTDTRHIVRALIEQTLERQSEPDRAKAAKDIAIAILESGIYRDAGQAFDCFFNDIQNSYS